MERVQEIASRILQEYSNRNRVLSERSKVMQDISFDINHIKVVRFSRDISRKVKSLTPLLEADEKLIYSIKKDYAGLSSELSKAIDDLKKSFPKGGKLKFQGGVLDIKNTIHFLENIISFIGSLMSHLNIMADRIKKERAFIKSRGIEHFKEFLNAWYSEITENQRILIDFENVIKKNPSIMNNGPLLPGMLKTMIPASGAAVFGVGMALVPMLGPLASLSIIATLVVGFMNYDKARGPISAWAQCKHDRYIAETLKEQIFYLGSFKEEGFLTFDEFKDEFKKKL